MDSSRNRRSRAGLLGLMASLVVACTGGSAAPVDAPFLDGSPDSAEAGSAQAEASTDAIGDSSQDLEAQADTSPEAPIDVVSEDAAAPAPALLSINLHCLKLEGTGFSTHEERFAAIAAAVNAENVVAIAVQEACSTSNQVAMEMLRDALQAATGVSWKHAFALSHVAWQGTPDEAQEGVGILARESLTDVQELEFWHQGALRRVALGATLAPSLGGLRLWSVHFEVGDPGASQWQARETAAWTLAQADPSFGVLVAGDFNAQEGSPTHAALLGFGFRDLTDALDSTRIDHILAHRGAPLSLIEAHSIFDGNPWPVVSDHHGVMVRFASGAGEPVVVTRLATSVSGPSGSHLSIRGSALPLTWAQGWPAASVGGVSKLVMTELPKGAPFEYKWLLDETTWQSGTNLTAAGGDTTSDLPTF
ncbi:MAG: endonuclease/exonuclease/phosphatase family protein [Deltaproteobacteria bacterium]|nr:endonuclease/exonuclease/phosphatase family protein [Deltaproteobacteria bacterium]